jgi:hypothetical protein
MDQTDPRMLPQMQRLYSHWIYTSYYLPPQYDHLVDITKYDAVIVDEAVARAVKYGNVSGTVRKVGVRTGSGGYTDIYGESMEPSGLKNYYYINEEDESNTVKFLKIEMQLYLKKHFDTILTPEEAAQFAEKRNLIESEIQSCDNIVACHALIHTRFGTEVTKDARQNGLGDPKFDLSEPGRHNF